MGRKPWIETWFSRKNGRTIGNYELHFLLLPKRNWKYTRKFRGTSTNVQKELERNPETLCDTSAALQKEM